MNTGARSLPAPNVLGKRGPRKAARTHPPAKVRRGEEDEAWSPPEAEGEADPDYSPPVTRSAGRVRVRGRGQEREESESESESEEDEYGNPLLIVPKGGIR